MITKKNIESFGFQFDKVGSSKTQWKFFKDNLLLFYRPNTKELGTFTIDPSKSDYMSKYNRDNKLISFLIVENINELKVILKCLKINTNE